MRTATYFVIAFLRMQLISLAVCVITGYFCGLMMFVFYDNGWQFKEIVDAFYHGEALFTTVGISVIFGSILGLLTFWPLRMISGGRILGILLTFCLGATLPMLLIQAYPIFIIYLAITGYVYGVIYLRYTHETAS